MEVKRLVIRINKYDLTFIDLYNDSSNIPIYSKVCSNQVEVNQVLKHINKMNICYQIEFIKLY